MAHALPDEMQNIHIAHYINLFVEKDVESLSYMSKPGNSFQTQQKLRVLDDMYRSLTMPTEQELDFLLHIEQDPHVRKRIQYMKSKWSQQYHLHQKNMNALHAPWPDYHPLDNIA